MWLQGMNTRTTRAPEDWIRAIVASSLAGPGRTTPGMVAEALAGPISANAHAQARMPASRRTAWGFPCLGIARFLGTRRDGLHFRGPCLARRRSRQACAGGLGPSGRTGTGPARV